MSAPLAGVRVLAVEQFGAGPFGTLFLADFGADVIKIEDPAVGGDVARYVPPGQDGSDSLYFESFNRGKRSMVLDLKSTGGQEVFSRLVRTADAVYNNLRGDRPAELRLTYETLEAINPAIVCVSLSGYGRDGWRASLPGYDALIQAEAGWAALTGEPVGPPTKSGLSLADYVGGLLSALGLMVAMFEARRTGRGRDIDTNLYDGALAMLSYPATWQLSRGIRTKRESLSAHPSIVPFQFFETADGHIALACPKERFFPELVKAIGLHELAADPRFADFAGRLQHRRELVEVLSARLRSETTAFWIERLRGVVPVGPVRSMEEALDPDELRQRDMLAEYEHPVLGRVRSVANPIRVHGFRPTYRSSSPLGADTTDLLIELGYDEDQRKRLAEAGAFGPAGRGPLRSAASASAGPRRDRSR